MLSLMRKNKKPLVKKITIILMIAIPVIVLLSILSDPYDKYKGTPYAAFSAKDNGTKAFYLSVKEYGKRYGFRTSIYTKYARFLPDDSIAVSINPMSNINDDYESSAIAEWVEKGNTYVIFLSEVYYYILPDLIDHDEIDLDSNDWIKIPRGSGYIILSNMDITNKSLKDNTEHAAKAMVMLKELGYNNIVFNEYHHGVMKGSIVGDVLGKGLYYFILEIFLGIALLLISLSDRLGSPVYVPDTVKRAENENVYALAGLYEKTKSLNIALLVHIESLLSDVAKALGYSDSEPIDSNEIFMQVEKDKYLKELGVADILKEYEFSRSGKPLSRKKIKMIINKIELIRKVL